ncbi:hypothetical protein, partial [Klebsiella pneumoniae]|uniref:hypothetical protein n=1 Tax=Klebsiella pneumoniae TaxID=573 RepID=UPI0034D56E8D
MTGTPTAATNGTYSLTVKDSSSPQLTVTSTTLTWTITPALGMAILIRNNWTGGGNSIANLISFADCLLTSGCTGSGMSVYFTGG